MEKTEVERKERDGNTRKGRRGRKRRAVAMRKQEKDKKR